MNLANRFVQPIDYYGTYKTNSWAGYVFKEALGYTTGKHTGADYNGAGSGNADLGLDIRAIANGIVRWTGNMNSAGYGNMTIIEHPLSATYKAELGCDSLFSRHMHQNAIEVVVGQEVVAGQKIGTVGNTGTTYAHLHLDLYKSTIEGGGVHFRYDKDTQLSSYLDPFEFIQSHNTLVDVETLLGYQRRVSNATGVNGRSAPNTGAPIVKEFAKDEVLDFKGYVVGQDPYGNGNKIWFVGKYSNTYWYSNAFSDSGTHDLPDLTPADPPVVTVPDTPTYPPATTDVTVSQVINKKHPLVPIDHVPSDLVDLGNGQLMRKEPATAFALMIAAGVKDNVHLLATSGYRSYTTQKAIYDGYVATDGQAKADTYSARPGYSEHQSGLVVDISGGGAGLDESFANTAESKWLVDNAYKYGFVMRYPKGRDAITGYTYEPWHYRYVGIEVARNMRDQNVSTLEEYFGIEGGNYTETPSVPIPPSDLDKENNELLKKILSIVTALWDKLTSIFK